MWSDEGTGKTRSYGNIVECNQPQEADQRFNSLWKEDDFLGVSQGEHCWKFKVSEGEGIFVGLTTELSFAPGYRCVGLLYGGPGNTSTGSSLAQGGFGFKPVKDGDEVVVLLTVSVEPRTVTVIFYHNGMCLGKAFEIVQPYPVPMYPMVSFGCAPGKVSIEKVKPPEQRARSQPQHQGPEGTYKLVSSDFVGATSSVVANKVIMQVRSLSTGFKVNIHAGNHIGASILPGEDGSWTAAQVASTLMYIEETQELEKALCRILETLTGFEAEQDRLTLRGHAGAVTFERWTPPPPEPFTRNVLR
eukprot:CAMPEP_0177626678 /NCGR_PEP_ID=MMETSP0419_2-20121207/30786_1 /TAXON_ID=582737 /ORGANISM="Tetraselmis sp., Strain GSL018" /LENGTH=302 /DNA_ID=CAMNT_0019127757 /DNA_START=126 /DNA_END=1034 /DNA_ORIENTATION=-